MRNNYSLLHNDGQFEPRALSIIIPPLRTILIRRNYSYLPISGPSDRIILSLVFRGIFSPWPGPLSNAADG